MSLAPAAGPQPFAAAFAPPDEAVAARLLQAVPPRADAAERRIDARATRLVQAIRSRTGGLGGIEDFLHAYALSTKEGLALMVLAEALLRVPDAATADRLIEDKLAAGDWSRHDARSTGFLVSASAWTLGLTARIVAAGERPESIVEALAARLGLPAVRAATRQAMRLLGAHFVLGQSIEQALQRAGDEPGRWYSFDMLGEGARTQADAERYLAAYAHAVAAIGGKAAGRDANHRLGMSVKLSALHPRYEAVSRARVLAELVPRLAALARTAMERGVDLTVDAEEADRLELSLDVMAAVISDPALTGWDGFGLAVQAYQKRAPDVIAWVAELAAATRRRVAVRLVKGAYWDTEIKRAQEQGLADYPVFTRKAMTDLCYEACARALIAARPRLRPQFATHNALTVASVIEDAGGIEGYEFQRLHGMGEALYAALHEEFPGVPCRIYAPVGSHHDLLAYLVRRLLENGANSSFVSVAADPGIPVAALLARPRLGIGKGERLRHPGIPLPRDLYAPERRNSAGVAFGDRTALAGLLDEIRAGLPRDAVAAPPAGADPAGQKERPILSPIDSRPVGRVVEASPAAAEACMGLASTGFAAWSQLPVERRAAVLDAAADQLEAERGRFMALLQAEGGKTLDDALSELREAVDLCRYYAAQARRALAPQPLPGPTGEANTLGYRGRGAFVCISPWNFPLAIFIGQVAAALAAGNGVLAKPAEQTPLVAAAAVRLLHRAGVPDTTLVLVPGDGAVGAALVAHPKVAGVAFTGSTEVGTAIARALAARDGPIVPLIAETGGINAMIVDATALPEQVVDDVLASTFRSAGQRCSALRLLCLQEDVADRMLDMIAGAAAELRIGDPRLPATHVGPVIDGDAKARLDAWLDRMAAAGRLRFRAGPLPAEGTYVAPSVVTLDGPRDLREEVFGPVLHVVRWRAGGLDALLDAIADNGYGLTLGIHSRIEATVAHVVARLPHGNVYVNRSMIGAVVGTQPFGGTGLSGTGPKAGGPNYLRRFAREQVVTVNTAAVGGNASLLAEEDEIRR